MSYRVLLDPRHPLARRRGGEVWQPGEARVYEKYEDIPELVVADHENYPGKWWIIEETKTKRKKTRRKQTDKGASGSTPVEQPGEESDEPPGDE